jgi:hypothetical protein
VFDSINRFDDGLIRVSQNGLHGLLDFHGEVVVPLEFNSLGNAFSEGLLAARKGEQWGFVNTSGAVEFMLDTEIDGVRDFVGGFAAVRIDGSLHWAHADWDYLLVLPNHAVIIDAKWGFVNRYGEIVVPIEYDWVRDFSESFAAVGGREHPH